MDEAITQSSEKFLLIRDLELSIKNSDFRTDKLETNQKIQSISENMIQLIRESSDEVDLIGLDQVWNKLSKFINPENDFVISLDGEFMVKSPNATIEMTRAATTVNDAEVNSFTRVARVGSPNLIGQVRHVRNRIDAKSFSNIVLFDDGLGSGNTVRTVLQYLKADGITVDRIIVLANPRQHLEIDGVPVETVFELPKNAIWLNERDLYWGVSRSGVSIAPKSNGIMAAGGIPYTYSKKLIESRIGITDQRSESFWNESLSLNCQFWKQIDQAHQALYPFAQCTRLSPFADLIGIDGNNVVSDYIGSYQKTLGR